MKQWKRLAALSSAIVMAAATLTYFPNDTLQNIRLELSASAETTTEPQVWIEGNLTWKLDADGTLTISGAGAMKDYDNGDNRSPIYKNSSVKKVVIEDGVTSIGERAFSNCSSLTNITIPNSVTCIEYAAFYGCSSLTNITIPDGVTSIGEAAFYACSTLTSITIPDSVTSIGNNTFYNCSGLTSITIPDSVTSIGDNAFKNCSSLTSITIPDSVTSIGMNVFSFCIRLKSISLSCGSALKKSDFGYQANSVSYTLHTLKKTAAKAVTCTEDGNKEYWTCEHCGKYFLSDDTNPETATAVELSETVIPASHKLTKVEAKAPTCTEDGNKEYWTCEHCGKYFLSDDANPETAKAVEQSEFIIPALKHKNATTRDISEPIETAPGYSGDLYCPDCDTVLEKGYTYWKEDNLTWTLYADGTLNISGKGAMKNYSNIDDDNLSPAYRNSNVRKIVIEDGVTSIGDSAFYVCSRSTSITIPDSVTSIGDYALAGCVNLTSITIPKNVTSIGHFAFDNCNNLTSITIPDSVTSIGNAAFSNCSDLTSITIPSSVTSIGRYAFYKCTGLTSITIPDSVKNIEPTAFDSCSSLKSISLSCKSSLKKSNFGDQSDLVSASHTLKKTEAKAATCTEDGNIEHWTCEHCGKYFLSDDTNPETAKAVEQSETVIPASHKLTKVEAKDATCTKDGNKEYWTCEHCKKYFLSDDANPETAKAVEQSETILPALKHKNAIIQNASEPTETAPGYSGDRYCPDCNTVLEKGYTYWNEGNLTWKLYDDGTLNISGTGAMKDYDIENNESPVFKNSNVKKVVIEDGVTSIGDYAFADCSSLTDITIPDSVTSIGYAAFYGCNSLTSITIPDSITSIGDFAFRYCTSLTSITIPDRVTSIGNAAFESCKGLTSITIPDSVTSIGGYAFYACSSLKTISLSCGSALKKSDFGDQADLVSASHTLKKTEAKAATCTENGNKEYWTCEHCKKYFLSDDTNPETAKAVEQSETVIPALNHKNAITRGASEPTETAPGYSGDRYCPDCDTVFEKGYAYWNEGNLTWKLDADGTLTISGTGAMKDYDYYNNPSPASQKKDSVKKVVIEDGVTSIRNSAFYDCNSLTSITIPNSVTSIGAYAFSNCYYLTNITIPNSVTSIENYAFRSCSSLTSITIPDSVTSIGELAFYSCDSLTSITISNSVTSIEERAFAYCSRLTSITIPDSVTSIGEAAFAGCSSLTSITIPDSVTSIGEYAFQSCSSLTSITIPDSVTSIGDYVFISCSSLTTISLSCKSSLKRSDFGKQADLVSYTSHTLNKTEAKAATCTENGNKEYWTCEHCKKYFLSDDANPETAKAVEQSECMIPAIQHKNAITRGASEPTETAPGYSGDLYCPDCDKVVEKGYTYWIEDNLTWKLYADGTLNISGAGAMKDYDYDNNPSPASQKKDSVKKVVIEDGVTSIGNSAFDSCSNLTSITIPDSVSSIGNFVFYGCVSLTSITIPNSVISIGSHAFSGCGLTSITIPNSVTSIEPYAFYNCRSLTSITIPNSVTSIGNFAFSDCRSLTSITIPDSVTSIGNYAFAYCEGLTSITIPDSVTSIGAYAFSYCSSLTSITIPNSVTSIGNGAFDNCSSLTSITISDRVTSIKPYAFSYCSSLTSITIPNSVTSIENFAFSKCSSLTNITIPDSVTSIGSSAFNGCSSLQTISLSCKSSLKKSDFGDQADLVSYTSHTLKKTEAKDATCTEDGNKEYWTCEHCGKYFLSDDTNPETAKAVEQSETVIPASHKLTKVEAKDATCAEDGNKEYWTCEHCKKYFLSDDTNPETAKAVEQSETIIPALKHKNATTRGASEPTETSPGYSGDLYCPDCDKVVEKGYTYWNEGNLTWKLYEDGTLNISGTGAMKDYNDDDNPSPVYQNSNVKKVVIEKGVTNIGKFAFSDCSSLTTITIPDNVTCIEYAAFSSCSSLTSITIPDGVTSIGDWAFSYCKNLTSITIPDSVTSIGDDAFYNCSSLTSITIPKNVTSIGNSVFENCSSLTDITIPDGVTSIGEYAFCNCTSLTSITIPDGVTSIEEHAFYGCNSLTSITIPGSVTSIENGMFYNCSSLTDIVIPNSVTSIGYAAFYGCNSLTSITIPGSVTSIGNKAFFNCSSLTDIVIPSSVTSIKTATFYGCSSLTSITIPDSVTSIENGAFYNCSSLTTISLSCKSFLKKSDFGDQADLVSALHTLKKTEAKAATYAENGNKAYWTCEHCGKYFLSDDSNSETATAVELSETVIPALVQIATTTTPIKCVYGQDMNKIDLRDYVKNTDVVGEVTVKVATGSTLPDGMKLDGSNLSGKPAKAYEDGKEVTFTFTAENGNTANLTLLFLVAKADPTVEVAVSGDSHTEGDLVSELKLILSENSTKGVVELVSEIKALVAGKNTLTWKFTPEDENNYHTVTGTVVVNAQTTTTTTTTKATTTTTKATTTTKPNKTTTTKVTTTTKPNKTTTTKVTTTTKPSKTTTTNATTTTKPNKTTTTKATTTTKPSKTTTTKVTTTTKPSKATTTKVTTTTTTTISSYGDVNLDGKVDIVDAIFLNKYLATLIQFSDAQVANADCCQDGVLDDQDTTALMQFIILLIDDLPVQPTEK